MIKILPRLIATPVKAFVSASILLTAIAVLDHYATSQISFASFYLLPILIVTWRINLNYGLAASVLSAGLWLFDDYWTMERIYTHPLIPYWNALIHLTFFTTSVVLLDRVKSLLQSEQAISRLKSDMIHTVSHEFNNSLTVMSAGIFLLKETEAGKPDETRSKLMSTLESAQLQMALYVKNILNEGRMQEGKFKLEKKTFALRDLAKESAESVHELLKQKNISLEVRLPDVPILVSADREALALVVSNLLGNAIKYTPQNGGIKVEVCSSGVPASKVIFSVEDTGIGISLEDQKKITGGFYRTNEGKNTASGFGLGLKISNDLLVLHGSRLEISSEKGKGSSFFFELPALPPGKGLSGQAGVPDGLSGLDGASL